MSRKDKIPAIGSGGELCRLTLDDGSPILLLGGVPVPPYGAIVINSWGVSDRDRELLDRIQSLWPELWPLIREKLLEGIRQYERDQDPERDGFEASAGWTEPDCFMGDVSEFHLSFSFDREPGYPWWDFFCKGTEIMHWQAVF